MVTLEEHPLAHDGREEGHHVDLDLGAPVDEPVLQRHRSHEAAGVPPALDGRHVDHHVLLQPVHDHRVAGLVQGDAVAFPLDVLVVVGQAMFFDRFGLQQVLPGDDLPVRLDRLDERLVDHVLDARARGVRAHHRKPLHLLGRHIVADLAQVALEGPYPALLAGVPDLVDAVDAAGPQQCLVQGLRHVGRHHDHDAVLRR